MLPKLVSVQNCSKLQMDYTDRNNNNRYYPCYKSNQVSVGDLRTLAKCVQSVNGQAANSASPTDIYRLQMKTRDFRYDGQYIPTLFMKVFMSEKCEYDRKMVVGQPNTEVMVSRPNTTVLGTQEMLYEYLIYMTKIKNIVDLNICPYFVRVLGGNLRVDFHDILNFLIETTTTTNTPSDIKNNLYRNMSFLYYNDVIASRAPKRPSINDNTKIYPQDAYGRKLVPIDRTTDLLDPIVRDQYSNDTKYGYFVTEGTPNTTTLADFLENGSFSSDNLYIILYQLIMACKTMNMAQLAHNDLHSGNILLEQGKFTEVILTNNWVYRLSSPLRLRIYDFDRGYNKDYYNSALDGLEYASQTNDLIEKRDLIKVIGYFFHDDEKGIKSAMMRSSDPGIIEFRKDLTKILMGFDDDTLLYKFYKKTGRFLEQQDSMGQDIGRNSDIDFSAFPRTFDEMLKMAYDNINPRYKPDYDLCIADPQVEIYHLNTKIFDTHGEILRGELDKLKNNTMKERCILKEQQKLRKPPGQLKTKPRYDKPPSKKGFMSSIFSDLGQYNPYGGQS